LTTVDSRPVVEEDLADRRSGEGVTDGHDREHLADLLPGGVRRIERRDHQPVDQLIRELARKHLLALRLATGIRHHHVEISMAELATERLDEALLAEVLQGAREHADEAGASAGEGTRHGVSRVAQLLRDPAHPLLRLGRGLHAAHRV
jgi:hypothetical protein